MSNIIQGAVEKTEKAEFEYNLAVAWNDGHYTDEGAKLSAEMQGLSWPSVTVARSRLYEIDAKAGRDSWN